MRKLNMRSMNTDSVLCNDAGVALTEAAFYIPVLMIILFLTIDFGVLFFQNYKIGAALRNTGRYMESQTVNCDLEAAGFFTASLENIGLDDRLLTLNGARETDETLTFIDATVPFVLTARVQARCISCAFIRQFMPEMEMNLRVAVVFEEPDACPADFSFTPPED